MTTQTCDWCRQPIEPGEPAMHTASVDIIDGHAVSTPARSYHIRHGCNRAAAQQEYAARRRREQAA